MTRGSVERDGRSSSRVDPEATSSARGPGKTIYRVLVIDDDWDTTQLLVEEIELMGHIAVEAYDGTSGVAQAKEFHPDVVLCDLGMPIMDGCSVARQLRADPVTARAYLIALSGYGEPEDLRLSREAGFDRHLVKPMTHERLLHIFDSLPAPAPS